MTQKMTVFCAVCLALILILLGVLISRNNNEPTSISTPTSPPAPTLAPPMESLTEAPTQPPTPTEAPMEATEPNTKITYTVEQVAQMLADYFQTIDPGPSTYVVFSEEAMIDGNICSLFVRLQRADATEDTGANILVASVDVNMDTGVAVINQYPDQKTIQLFEVS